MNKLTSAVKVLVVDDQPLIVEELCEFLESSGYRCVPCVSSKQAIEQFIEDTTIISPVESATMEGLMEATREVLAGLTAREAKVLRMRFGIDMHTDHTLEEVGKQFDVTRERIRQIEAKALRKLRHPSRSDHLRSFLDD